MRSGTQPRVFEMRQSPIRFLSITRPYCHAQTQMRAELAVVAAAIEHLLGTFDVSEIRYQYNLGPGCRPDIAVLRDGYTVQLFEVKSAAVNMATVRQAQRYLAVALARWPERGVQVWCVGTSISPRLGPPPAGIAYAVVHAD